MIPQSLRDEDEANRARRDFVDPRQWFDVPDSELIDDNGNGTGVFNVQAKFADHHILNVEKSRAARHNVYDLGIVLHTKVMHLADGSPVIKNSSSHVMRFDKGEDDRVASYRPGPDGKEVIHYDGREGMGQDAFNAAVRDITRCWDAWQHYQKFREAKVHPLELRALSIIDAKPMNSLGTVMVDRGDGKLVARKVSDDDDGDEDAPTQPRRAPARKSKKA